MGFMMGDRYNTQHKFHTVQNEHTHPIAVEYGFAYVKAFFTIYVPYRQGKMDMYISCLYQ